MEPDVTLALVLIGAGFLLMVAELFIPSGGVLSILSACGVIGGVVMMFLVNTSYGLGALAGVCLATPVVISVLFHYWPKTPIGRRFVLTPPSDDATLGSLPEHVEMTELRGQVGQAMSSLRPAGVVDFGGRRVDCITEGIMVEKGQWVRCIDVKGCRVLVRPVDKPNLTDLESADFS